jgi:hypothetical protein
MDFYPRFLPSILQAARQPWYAAVPESKRIATNQAIIDDLQDLRSGDSKLAIKNVAFERNQVVSFAQTRKAKQGSDLSSQDTDISHELLLEHGRMSMTKRYSKPTLLKDLRDFWHDFPPVAVNLPVHSLELEELVIRST